MTDGGQWEFPEDVIVDRAMIEALIDLLAKQGTIEMPALREQFVKRLNAYKSKEAEAEPKQKVAAG
jgi:hypothetical protein